jgi:hypothetical protein
MGQPRGVFDRLLDVLPLEIRIALHDLLERGSVPRASRSGSRSRHLDGSVSPRSIVCSRASANRGSEPKTWIPSWQLERPDPASRERFLVAGDTQRGASML